MQNWEKYFWYKQLSKNYHLFTVVISWFLFSSFSFGNKDDVLVSIQDREITKPEFLHFFHKNYNDSVDQNIDLYFDQFIDMHLKLAHARQEQLDRNIGFITEFTNFRMQLSENYLPAKIKEEEPAHTVFVEKLKKEWNFKENQAALETLLTLGIQTVQNNLETILGNVDPLLVLCTIDGKNLIMHDFFRYITDQDNSSVNIPVKLNLLVLYKRFISDSLINYENYILEDKYPEFRFQLWEYRDAMLLLEITQRQVWQKSTSDSLGLIEFYKNNIEKYRNSSNDVQKLQPAETFPQMPYEVLSDYQSFFMNAWVGKLHNKYKVQINQKVFFSIKEAFTKKEM